MIRLRRRHATSVRAVPRAVALAWGRRGWLHPLDACGLEARGTLEAREVRWLRPALARGARRRAGLALGALGAVVLAAGAALGPTLAAGLAALLLLALAHALLGAWDAAPRLALDALPLSGVDAYERRRLFGHLARALQRAAGVCAVAGVAAGPGSAASLALALTGLGAWGAARLLVLL